MNFTITCQDHAGYNIPYTTKTFAGGEVHVQLHDTFSDIRGTVVIKGLVKNSNMLMELFLLADALKNVAVINRITVTADIGYLPYARQDRVCAGGQAFSLEMLVKLMISSSIDWWNFEDIHSRAFAQVANREGLDYKIISQQDILRGKLPKGMIVVAPDAGAKVKAEYVAAVKDNPLAYFKKVRDPETGQITSVEPEESLDVQDLKCIIVDDICDYGGTFIPIIQQLKEAGASKVYLYVTHLVLPVSPDKLKEAGVDAIFYKNKFNNDLNQQDKVYPINAMQTIFS